MPTSFDSDQADNPLVPFSEKATKSPALGDDGNTLEAIGVGTASTDPVQVRPLSQMAWEQMNPQQQADATAEAVTGGSVSQAAGVGAGGTFATDFVDGVFFDASQGGAVEPDGNSVPLDDQSFGYGPRRAPRGNFVTDDTERASKIVQFAKSMIGRPYIWGGTSRAGVDCSGLVQLAYAAAGVEMPRLSYTQLAKGIPVALNKLKPGDLIGWDNDQPGFGGVDHIAIYIGNGQYIEAPRPGLSVRVMNLADTAVSWAVRIPGAPAPFAGKSRIARQVESGRISIRQAEHDSAQRAKKKKPSSRPSGHPTTRSKVKPGTNTNARKTRTRKNRQRDAINRGR